MRMVRLLFWHFSKLQDLLMNEKRILENDFEICVEQRQKRIARPVKHYS